MKIAVTTYSLINNHGFIDGNKRIGVAVMILLLKLNDIEIKFSQNELINFGLDIVAGKMDQKNIYEWIIEHNK